MANTDTSPGAPPTPATPAPRHARVVGAADEATLRAPLLGMPLALRAVWAAKDAGAVVVHLEGGARAVAADAEAAGLPIASPADADADAASLDGPTLVVRADALVSPALLARLAPGEVVVTAEGTPVAGLLTIPEGADPLAALDGGRPLAFAAGGPLYAHLPDTPPRRKAAHRALLASLTKPQDGPASRHINRKVSTRVTALLIPLGVSPNAITLVVGLFGLAAAWFAASPLWGWQILGAVLYQAHSILDGCDGEIARLTKRFSKHGALLDSVVDDVSNLLFFVALSIGVHRGLDADWALWAGVVTAVGYLGVTVLQFAVVLRATGRGFKSVFWETPGAAPRPLAYRMLHAALRRDVFIWICLALVVVGAAPALVAIMPFAAVGALAATIGRARKG